MYERHQLRIRVGLERIFEFARIDGLTPVILDGDCDTPAAQNIFLHASAEHTIDTDDDLVTRLHEIDETGFHARRSGG